ncbi:hypothetical protein ACRAWD_01225 [Caulobacter segnis]
MGEGKPRAAPVLTRIAGGEMAARVRAFDWSTTPLGAMDAWSPALRLATDMILATNFPAGPALGPRAGADLQRRLQPGPARKPSPGPGHAVQRRLARVPDLDPRPARGHPQRRQRRFAFEKLPLKESPAGAK